MRFYQSVKPFKKLTAAALALMIVPVAVACDSQAPETVDNVGTEVPAETEADTAAETMPMEGETIVDVAAANGSFNTLVAAVEAAGLVDTLSSEGPFTVFAPTDDAFAALPDGILEQLLLPENQEVLASILTYHVVAGEVTSSDIAPGMVPTVEGSDLDVSVEGGTVMVSGATVVQPDVMASNGVIHVIDTVLLPPTLDLDAL